MFKSIGNDNSIPNSYIYTSHRGTEYMYLDGSWINCETMNEVSNVHNFKMNQSAIRQIAEHNNNSTLKIGKTYIINESAIVYVGRNTFTKNGNLLNENINNKVKKLVEANNEDSDSTESDASVPNGYVYISGKGKTYMNRNGTWYDTSTKKPINSSAAQSLQRAALAAIQKHNQSEPVKIGQEWTSGKGNVFTYVGNNRFISKDGKLLPAGTATKALQQLQGGENSGESSGNTEEQPEQNQGSQNPQPQPSNPEPNNSGNSGNSGSTGNSTDNSSLEALAREVKSSPNARRIIPLLSRGDAVSLMAADILLSGQEKEAKQIIQSLNNKD